MALRLLVVDDDPQVVKIVQRSLEHEGFEVATAYNGAECLLAVGSQRPDLLLLDVTMPVLDGFETLRVLRERPDTRDLPVVMLTARSEGEDVARGLAGGADFYLTKPFQNAELVAAVKRVLETSGSRRTADDAARDQPE
jgi:DNA-binding response OmpR family regulator